jgi:hypothetical protein
LSAEHAFGAALRENLTDVRRELLDEFCDHFTRHPKQLVGQKLGDQFFS